MTTNIVLVTRMAGGFHSTCALLTLPRCQTSLSGVDGIQSPGRGQATVWPSVPPAATSSSQPVFSCATHG
ncbi:hypothetical protein KOW79_009108 [Hemibagrus wyckioides]|uniref:Uncharacterized protein n=1 Tax=Hemibagrus wyckioides TaxID=337641 RepID=A0A9D3SKN2_9TELE|nr:hypothetical protein KOW79_009108 [Hemibagrus wyckioides]